MKKSGLADSPFFTKPEAVELGPTPPPKKPPVKEEKRGAEKAVYLSGDESVAEETKQPVDSSANRPGERPGERSAGQSTNRSTDQLTDRPTDRPIDQSTGQSTEGPSKETESVDDLGPVVDRPRAFYITAMVDRWLDEAVRYLKGQGLHKADRSVLVNALLHDPELYKPPSLDKMRARFLAHLTNKSLKRVQSTD